MRQLKYQVKFLTPAFLGNAGQSGQWRTPPFKALLRQWWRVAVARDVCFKHDRLRKREALLFGHAWFKGDQDRKGKNVAARASRVRVRLDHWSQGKLPAWRGLESSKVKHPEVRVAVGPHLYLGYGPLVYDGQQRTTKLRRSAIDANESGKLSLAVPDEHASEICSALALMDAYGALGGRSRNGWGSFNLRPTGGTPPLSEDFTGFVRPYDDALKIEWPNSIGQDDGGPLVWRTRDAYSDWRILMRDLAIIKIRIRTKFKFPDASPHQCPHGRHWLAYPITHHDVIPWKKKNLRLPNTLRFKVRVEGNEPPKLRGVIFHVPCLPPRQFDPGPDNIKHVWQFVYRQLDSFSEVPLERIAA